MKQLSLSTQLALGFGTVVLVLLIVAAVGLRGQSDLSAAVAMNDHTYQVIATGRSMSNASVNMETGARGFLLSGNDANLNPYRNGMLAFDKGVRPGQIPDLRQPDPAGTSQEPARGL